MSRQGWEAVALCRSYSPADFFPTIGSGAAYVVTLQKAVEICGRCEVDVQCLASALASSVVDGVYGGIDFHAAESQIGEARAAKLAGDPVAMAKAVSEARIETARRISGESKPKVWTDARSCVRCDSEVAEGWYPEDTNGPGATCGLAATYNKGCRCGACIDGKAKYHKSR